VTPLPDSSVYDRPFDAILLDMDGTLVDSTAVVERTWRDWAARMGLDPEPILQAAHGVPTFETVRRFAPQGVDIHREAEALVASEVADVDGIVAVDGAPAFLAALPVDRWAVVTSASRALADRRMQAAGIAPPPVFVTADEIAAGKPDPEGYLVAAERLGVKAADCLVVEDSPAGIRAGEAAGAAVLVITATHRHPVATDRPTRRDFTGLACAVAPAEGVRLVRVSDPVAHSGGAAR